jgi:hypothetical protein
MAGRTCGLRSPPLFFGVPFKQKKLTKARRAEGGEAMKARSNWRRLSAQARAAVPKLYFAEEQADMLALLDTLDSGMEMLDSASAEDMSDEQIANMLDAMRAAARKPSSN